MTGIHIQIRDRAHKPGQRQVERLRSVGLEFCCQSQKPVYFDQIADPRAPITRQAWVISIKKCTRNVSVDFTPQCPGLLIRRFCSAEQSLNFAHDLAVLKHRFRLLEQCIALRAARINLLEQTSSGRLR